jgi:hypothetical protein
MPSTFYRGDRRASDKWAAVKIGIRYRQLVYSIFACVWSKQGSRGKKLRPKATILTGTKTTAALCCFSPLSLHLLLLATYHVPPFSVLV